MKTRQKRITTEGLLSVGMALQADRSTMEQRIRGIFSRRSSRVASAFALLLAVFMVVGCFTTACRPVTAEQGHSVIDAGQTKPAAETLDGQSVKADGEMYESLLAFAGPATAKLDGNTVTVTSADGKQTVFTVVDDGIAEYSQSFDGLSVVTPQQAAMEAARVAVTLWGDAVTGCEIHVEGQKYAETGNSMAYYEIGMGGKSWAEGSGANGLVDAATGTLLSFDANEWGKNSAKYGHEFINEKIRTWEWDSENYADVHTSEKAIATAVALVEKCFPTGTVIPCVTKDGPDWDTVSYTDGEQIAWSGGYMALVDVYLRMDKDPCYYARIGVPLEEGAEPTVEIFSTYPLGWEYCKEGTWDPAQLAMLREEYEQIRATGEYHGSGYARSYSVHDEETLNNTADVAVGLIGQTFYLGDDLDRSYNKEFVEEQGKERMVSMAFVDISLSLADPWTVQWLNLQTPEEVVKYALRGQTLEFGKTGIWAVYIGDGQCVYAKAESDGRSGIITQESVEDMMKDGSHCHLQINDYMVVSPGVEALLDSSEAQVTQGYTGEQLMPRPTPVPEPIG